MRKMVVLWFMTFLLLSAMVSAVPHKQYPSYEETMGRATLANDLLVVSDDLIYYRSYYSVNGGNWIPYNLQGNSYKGSNRWFAHSASAMIPSMGLGEHYIIIYTCSNKQKAWDCHDGKWQLLTVEHHQEQNNPHAQIVSVEASTSQVSEVCHNGRCAPEYTLDGLLHIPEKRWAACGDGHWILYELNTSTNIDHIDIATWGNPVKYFFDIEVSTDKQNWKQIFSGTTDGKTEYAFERIIFNPVQAQYVRLIGRGNDGDYNCWNALLEVRIQDLNNTVGASVEQQMDDEKQEQKEGKTERMDDKNIIFAHDFEDNALGLYNRTKWREDWNNPRFGQRLGETWIVDMNGNKAMKMIFHNGTWGVKEGALGGGGQWPSPLEGYYEELYLSYDVYLPPNFDIVRSVKLPGLVGGPQSGAGYKPDYDDGFFSSLSLHGTANPRGTVIYYLYYQNQEGDYGDVWGWPDPYGAHSHYLIKDEVSDGTWVNFAYRLVLNSVGGEGGNEDGYIEGFANGKFVSRHDNLLLRNHQSIGIDTLWFYTHYGGNGEEFATAKDEWILFDNFYVWQYTNDSREPRGDDRSPATRTIVPPNTRVQIQ